MVLIIKKKKKSLKRTNTHRKTFQLPNTLVLYNFILLTIRKTIFIPEIKERKGGRERDRENMHYGVAIWSLPFVQSIIHSYSIL